MKMFDIKWSKDKLLLNQEQVSNMSADEIARYIRDNNNAWIVRNDDGSIQKIVKRTFTATPV